MPSRVSDADDVEVSFTYASYERETEASSLLPGDKSTRFLSNSSRSQKSIEESIKDGGKQLASKSRGVIIFVACLYMNLSCFGMVAVLGVVYVEFISAFQCLRSEAALVQSLYMGLSLAGGILFSIVVTKYDTGACVMIASALAGIALSCASLARNIGTVIALVGIVVGLFTSVNTLSSSIVINWTFVSNQKFALGILTLGATIGQTVMPYITNALIEEYSWNGCLLIMGALIYFNCIPCGLIIHYSKKYFYKQEKSNAQRNSASFISFLTDSAFMVFIVSTFVFILLGPVEQWFVVDVAVLKGFGAKSGATLLSLNGIFGFVGRFLATALIKFYPKSRPELHMCYGFILWAIAHFSVVASPVYWGMFLAMVLRGCSTSIVIAFLPSLQLELRGTEQFPKTLAISYLVMGIGDIIGGYLGGYSVDVTGSYNLIFYIATVGMIYCGISMIVIFVIFRQRKRQYQNLP